MTKATDCYDRSIRVGDGLTYPVRKGSDMWLSDGKVLKINDDGSVQLQKSDTGRITTIKNTHTTILATDSVRRAINSAIKELEVED